MYTDENPSDTVSVKFRTKQDVIDTLNKDSFKSKSHARQSQIINLIHQRLRVALERAKDPEVKKRLRTAFEYIESKKESSKRKTKGMKEGLHDTSWQNDEGDKITLMDLLKPYLIEGKYLYHYTPTYNLDDIKEKGLIPRKPPNSFYKDGIEGIFLTNKSSLYSANLPQNLMNLMDEYYENGEEYEKPIVRLTIDVTQLNPDKITWDDDYIMNQYKWNKANTDEDKIIESIDIWGTISYKGLIPPELIINEDFDYLS